MKGNANGIRVANHQENDGLKYKYNIRTDIEHQFTIDGRHYFSAKDISRAINFILRQEKQKYALGA
jgi:hypothetical protein